MDIQKVKLSDFVSLKLGGTCDLVRIKNEEELIEALMYAKTEGLRVHILGEGTNTFFANNLPNLLVLKIELKGIKTHEEKDFVFVTAQAGEIWDDVVKLTVNSNWWGIENLSYIPGTVGASPVQNIGAYGVELKDIFESLRAYDMQENKFVELKNKDCNFGYRDSLFKKEKNRYIICSVTLKLSKNKNERLEYKPLDILKNKIDLNIRDVRDLVIKTRKEKLPDYKDYPNAGSFFKNVLVTKEKFIELQKLYTDISHWESGDLIKISTAWLIENVASMKGIKGDNIGTWEKQPLILINYGTDNAQKLLDFEEEIKKRVFEKTGIGLEREVNYITC